jgi:hypothetical protein
LPLTNKNTRLFERALFIQIERQIDTVATPVLTYCIAYTASSALRCFLALRSSLKLEANEP